MINKNQLRAKMAGLPCSVKTLTQAIGMSKSAFYRRLNGKTLFTVPEMLNCAKYLQLTDAERDQIFFLPVK